MINILALALLVSSLAAAGVWSPPPSRPTDPHLIREGHRLIVVEYERHVPSETPSPPPTTTTATHNIVEEAKEKLQEASSLLPNLGQGISTPESTAVEKPAHLASDLICDAYGSCKEKISSVFHKGKDKISRTASDVSESAKEAVERAKEKASDIKEGATDAVRSTVEKASEIEERAKDAVKSAVRDVAEVTMDGGEDAVGSISETLNLLNRNLTDILNRARDVAFGAAKYVGAAQTGRAVAETAHLLAFVVAYGTCVWVTFVSSDVLATVLPRQQFGMVQSKLYPVYFRAVAYAIGIACLGHFFAKKRVAGAERALGYNLLAALGLVLVNMFYLEPKATKVMFERMKMEKEEGQGRDMADVIGEPVMTTATATTTAATQSAATTIGVMRTSVVVDPEAVKSRAAKLNKKLRKLNSYSSFLNILTLMSFTWHLVNLAQRLQRTC